MPKITIEAISVTVMFQIVFLLARGLASLPLFLLAPAQCRSLLAQYVRKEVGHSLPVHPPGLWLWHTPHDGPGIFNHGYKRFSYEIGCPRRPPTASAVHWQGWAFYAEVTTADL